MARTAGRDWFSPCVITASSCWLWSPLVEIGAVRPARPPGAGRPLLDQGEEPVRSRRERRQHDRWRAGPLRLSFSRSAASPAIWARVRACSEAPGDNARPIGSPTLRTSPKWTSVELPSCWSAFRPCGDSRRRPGTPEGICAAAIWNLAHEILANVVASTASPTWNIALGVVQWTPRLWSDLDHSRAFCER